MRQGRDEFRRQNFNKPDPVQDPLMHQLFNFDPRRLAASAGLTYPEPSSPIKFKKHEKEITVNGNKYRESEEDEPDYEALRRMRQDELAAKHDFNEQEIKRTKILISPSMQQQHNDYKLRVNQQNLDVIHEFNKKKAIKTLQNQQMMHQNPVIYGSKKEKAIRMNQYYDEIIAEILDENGKDPDYFDPMSPNLYHGHEEHEKITPGYVETILIAGTDRVIIDNVHHVITYKFPTDRYASHEEFGTNHHAFHHKASEFLHIIHIKRYSHATTFTDEELELEHKKNCRIV
jgi:hypothetical protein